MTLVSKLRFKNMLGSPRSKYCVLGINQIMQRFIPQAQYSPAYERGIRL
jgi:hypothetical protein